MEIIISTSSARNQSHTYMRQWKLIFKTGVNVAVTTTTTALGIVRYQI
jgi:hypothetical protein